MKIELDISNIGIQLVSLNFSNYISLIIKTKLAAIKDVNTDR